MDNWRFIKAQTMNKKEELNNKLLQARRYAFEDKSLCDIISTADLKIKISPPYNESPSEEYLTIEMNALVALELHKGEKLALNKNEYEIAWDDFFRQNSQIKFCPIIENTKVKTWLFLLITGRVFYADHLTLHATIIPPDGEFYQ